MIYKIGELKQLIGVRGKFKDIFSDKPGIYKIVYRNHNPEILEFDNCNIKKSLLLDKFEKSKNKDYIVYIGKADNLGKRLKQYIRHGLKYKNNTNIKKPHYGGRYIWHIQDIDIAEVYIELNNNPKLEESRLLQEFKINNNNLPFANLIN